MKKRSKVTSIRADAWNMDPTFHDALKKAQEGDALAIFSLRQVSLQDGKVLHVGEHYFCAVLFVSDDSKVLSRLYTGKPEWVEPIPGTTVKLDDKFVTLIDSEGKKSPCKAIGTTVLLRGELPNLPKEYFLSFRS